MKKYLTLANLGWLFTAFVAVMLGMGGFSKIFGTEEMVNNFTFMNLTPYLTMVGILEVLGVILFVYPPYFIIWFRSFGFHYDGSCGHASLYDGGFRSYGTYYVGFICLYWLYPS